jgi:hypothetical protein
MELFAFSAAWLAIVYLFHSLVARSWKRVDVSTALLYASTISLIGVFGEVFADTLYNAIFGKPLWIYYFLPIHSGYTSLYSVFVWGMYGFHLYLKHNSLSKYNHRTRTLALFIAAEAIVLEFLLNISFIYFFGDYYFYYLPGDLWHLTTFQAVPIYFFAGIVMVKTIKHFKVDPRFYIAMNLMLVFVFTYLAG